MKGTRGGQKGSGIYTLRARRQAAWTPGQPNARPGNQPESWLGGQPAERGGWDSRFFSLWSESQTEVGGGAGEFCRSGASLGWKRAFLLWSESGVPYEQLFALERVRAMGGAVLDLAGGNDRR